MQFIRHGYKSSLLINAGLQQLHKISDEAAQLLLSLYQGRVFDRIQCIVHKMRGDLILQRLKLRVLFQSLLLDHPGDQILQVVKHVVKFPAKGSDLILCGHIHPKAQITFADLFHGICHIFNGFIHGSGNGCGKNAADHEKQQKNSHQKYLHLLQIPQNLTFLNIHIQTAFGKCPLIENTDLPGILTLNTAGTWQSVHALIYLPYTLIILACDDLPVFIQNQRLGHLLIIHRFQIFVKKCPLLCVCQHISQHDAVIICDSLDAGKLFSRVMDHIPEHYGDCFLGLRPAYLLDLRLRNIPFAHRIVL